MMDAAVEWQREQKGAQFAQNLMSRKAKLRLRLLRSHRDDFGRLSYLYADALPAQQWCMETEQWSLVLDYFDALKVFLHRQGYWQEAAVSAERAVTAAQAMDDTHRLAEAHFQRGLISDETTDYDRAEQQYQKAIQLAAAGGIIGVQAEAARRLGWLAHVQGDGETAVTHYRRALALHRQINDVLGQARDRRQMGMLAVEHSQLETAAQELQAALELLAREESWEATRLLGNVHLEYGRLVRRQGKLSVAQNHLQEAHNFAVQADDKPLALNIRLNQLILQTSVGDMPLSKVEQAFQHLQNEATQMGNRRAQTAVLNAKGAFHFRLKEYKEAQETYEQAYPLAGPRQRAIVKAQLGNIALKQEDDTLAEARYQEALARFLKLNALREAAGCYQQLGIVAKNREDWPQALSYYQEALKLRRRQGLNIGLIHSLYQLGNLSSQLDLKELACRYYREAYELGKRLEFNQLALIEERLQILDC